MTVLIVLVAGGALLGFTTARWWSVAFGVAAMLVYYAGLDSAWWGNGTGDGWEYVMVLSSLLAAAVTFASVAARRTRRR
jgi:hypothetical protein